MRVRFIKCDVTSRLKDVKLKGSHLKPYSNASIHYKTDMAHIYKPCQNYVLFNQIRMIEKIDKACREQTDHMISNLRDGYLEITTNEGIMTFTPPIVEKDYFLNGDYIINDGIHRMYYSMNFIGDPITCIVVDGATCPYYSYPTKWEDVDLLGSVIPDDFVKKNYRVKEYKKLYRDFNSVFLHPVGKPRGRGQQ